MPANIKAFCFCSLLGLSPEPNKVLMYQLQNKVNGKKIADLVQLVLVDSGECFVSGQKGRFAGPSIHGF